jgi:hypothetical protein
MVSLLKISFIYFPSLRNIYLITVLIEAYLATTAERKF